jgi:tetratricopeptide (TPR) repeat protein
MSVSYEGVPYDDALTVMRASVDEALRVDPSAAEAHAARGMIRAREFNWPGAIESFQRAMASDPRLTLAATDFVATTLIPLERANYAERVLATAKRHDPSSLEIDRELGTVYLASGRYAEAVTKYQFVLARDPAAVYARLNQAMVWAGAPEKAIRRWEDRPGLPGNNGYIAHALVRVGRRADAEALLPLTLTRGQPRAMVQTALGNLDGAFDALEQMMIQEPHRVPRLLAFPEMDILRGHPRLAELKKRLNLPQ